MSAGLVELLGDTLQGADGKVSTAEALAGKKAVALYFSAHWCPPCRGFTPQLAGWYSKDLKAKGLEVVFLSSDRSDSDFDEYFKEMPWLALPFADREKKEALSKKFRVQGIPSLVIVDEEGKTITKEGRAAVSEDPAGDDLPWKPKKVAEMLEGAKIVGKDGQAMSIKDAAKGKAALALYFSAHWCPPCRGFTPQLAGWYNSDLKAKGLEVVFVSWDREECAFQEYYGEQPWLALDYADRKLSKQLGNALGVDGIPALVVLDSELNVVNKDGRSAVCGDPQGNELPWHPKAVNDMAQGPGDINEVKTVVAFCEAQDAAQQKAIEEALKPVAEKYLAKQKAADDGEPPEFAFMVNTSAEGVGTKVRSLSGLPETPAPGPILALYDIPDNGGFYLAPEGTEITTASVEKFLSDFASGALERKQLG